MSQIPTYDAARTFDATSLTGSYQDVGAVMASPVAGHAMYNTSDVDIQLSFDDGVNDGPIIPAGGTFTDNRYSQLHGSGQGSYVIASGAQIQVKQVTGAGTTGNLIVNIIRK
jgi:hypothetical protein